MSKCNCYYCQNKRTGIGFWRWIGWKKTVIVSSVIFLLFLINHLAGFKQIIEFVFSTNMRTEEDQIEHCLSDTFSRKVYYKDDEGGILCQVMTQRTKRKRTMICEKAGGTFELNNWDNWEAGLKDCKL